MEKNGSESSSGGFSQSLRRRVPRSPSRGNGGDGGNRETIDVVFHPDAMQKFTSRFDEHEQQCVLTALSYVERELVEVERSEGVHLKQVTLFKARFFLNLLIEGEIHVVAILADDDQPPPPEKKKGLFDAVVSGSVSGFIRWVLDQIQDSIDLRGDYKVSTLGASPLQGTTTFYKRRYRFAYCVALQQKSPNTAWYVLNPYEIDSFKHKIGADGSESFMFSFSRSELMTLRERDLLGVERKALTCDWGSWRYEMTDATEEYPPEDIADIETFTSSVNGEVLTTFRVPISRTVNVKAIRNKLEMTQQEFAQAFGLSLPSLRNWEQGTRMPERPIALYLRLIEKYPDEVRHEVASIRAESDSVELPGQS